MTVPGPHFRDQLAELGVRLIADERRRQVEQEGWTPQHDGEHGHAAELMRAGQAYMRADGSLWPWHDGWKPKGQFRNLVRAGALFQAALDTGDLAALAGNAEGFRNVCARLVDELVSEVADALLPLIAAHVQAEVQAATDRARQDGVEAGRGDMAALEARWRAEERAAGNQRAAEEIERLADERTWTTEHDNEVVSTRDLYEQVARLRGELEPVTYDFPPEETR